MKEEWLKEAQEAAEQEQQQPEQPPPKKWLFLTLLIFQNTENEGRRKNIDGR